MAVVTVVNGSPHPEGYTSNLVQRIVDGIETAGARADVIATTYECGRAVWRAAT